MDLLKQTKIFKNENEKGSEIDPFSDNFLRNQKNEKNNKNNNFNALQEIKIKTENTIKQKENINTNTNNLNPDAILEKHSIYSLLINCEYLNNLKIKPRKDFLSLKSDQKLILFNDFFYDVFYIKDNELIVLNNFSLISFIELNFKKDLDKFNINKYNLCFLNSIPRSIIEPNDYILYKNEKNCYLCEYFDFKRNICKL